jgi:alkaline phosphatase D
LPPTLFAHGVASGDPLADGVMLWTRVSPTGLGLDPVPVRWRVATDPDLDDVVAEGEAEAAPTGGDESEEAASAGDAARGG